MKVPMKDAATITNARMKIEMIPLRIPLPTAIKARSVHPRKTSSAVGKNPDLFSMKSIPKTRIDTITDTVKIVECFLILSLMSDKISIISILSMVEPAGIEPASCLTISEVSTSLVIDE